jgi:hypothetical protein
MGRTFLSRYAPIIGRAASVIGRAAGVPREERRFVAEHLLHRALNLGPNSFGAARNVSSRPYSPNIAPIGRLQLTPIDPPSEGCRTRCKCRDPAPPSTRSSRSGPWRGNTSDQLRNALLPSLFLILDEEVRSLHPPHRVRLVGDTIGDGV